MPRTFEGDDDVWPLLCLWWALIQASQLVSNLECECIISMGKASTAGLLAVLCRCLKLMSRKRLMQLLKKNLLSLFYSALGWKFSAAYFTVAAVLVAVPLRYSPSVRKRLKVPSNATIMAFTTCSRHVSRVSCEVANSIFALTLWLCGDMCLLLLQDAVESNA